MSPDSFIGAFCQCQILMTKVPGDLTTEVSSSELNTRPNLFLLTHHQSKNNVNSLIDLVLYAKQFKCYHQNRKNMYTYTLFDVSVLIIFLAHQIMGVNKASQKLVVRIAKFSLSHTPKNNQSYFTTFGGCSVKHSDPSKSYLVILSLSSKLCALGCH